MDDLHRHNLIGVHSLSAWKLTNNKTQQQVELHPKYTTLVNDIRFASQLACDAIGVALLPISEVNGELKSGALQQILTPWSGPIRDVFAVWPSGKLLNAKAKCLRDFMQQHFLQDPILQGKSIF